MESTIETIKRYIVAIAQEENAIKKLVYIVRLNKLIEDYIAELAPAANAIYTELEKEKLGNINFENIALLSAKTPKGTWKYPEEVSKLARDLKIAQAAAIRNKTATKQDGKPLNPTTDLIFKVTLL